MSSRSRRRVSEGPSTRCVQDKTWSRVIQPFRVAVTRTLAGIWRCWRTRRGISPVRSLKTRNSGSLLPSAAAQRATVKPLFSAFVVLMCTRFDPLISFVRLGGMSNLTIVWSMFSICPKAYMWRWRSRRIFLLKCRSCSSKSAGTFWLLDVQRRLDTWCCFFHLCSHMFDASKSWKFRPAPISRAFLCKSLFLTTRPSLLSSCKNSKKSHLQLPRLHSPTRVQFQLSLFFASFMLQKDISVCSPHPNLFSVHSKLFCRGTDTSVSVNVPQSSQLEFYCARFSLRHFLGNKHHKQAPKAKGNNSDTTFIGIPFFSSWSWFFFFF